MSDPTAISSSASDGASSYSANTASSPFPKPAAQPAAPKKTMHWVIVLIVIPWILAGLTLFLGRMFVERGG